MRWVSLIVIALSLAIGQTAHADAIDKRAKQLRTSDSYKVRLSAAAWLAKKRDDRAIEALAHAVANEPEKGIRRIAAKALPKMVSAKTDEAVLKKVAEALDMAAATDADKTVKRRAKRALKTVAALRSPSKKSGKALAARQATSGIFVNIGNPHLGKHKAPKGLQKALQKLVSSQLKSKLSSRYYQLAVEQDSALPTQAQLQQSNQSGWFVGASVAALKVTTQGAQATVSCTVNIRVNPWDGSDGKQRLVAHDTAQASGSASVKSANTKRDIGYAKQDCLLAVTEQLTQSRVVPFFKQKGPVAARPAAKKRVRVSRASRSSKNRATP